MAAPTTLIAFHTAELARLTAAAAELAVELPAAAAAQAGADAALGAASAAIAAADDALDALRRQLAAIATPADGDPLLAALRAARIAAARARAEQAAAEGDAAAKRASLAFWSRRRGAVDAALREAREALAAAESAAAERQRLADDLGAAPLADLPGAAGAALAAEGAAAQALVCADIPADADPAASLLARLRARRSLAAGALGRAAALAADARAQHDAWIEKSNRKADRSARLAREFEAQWARARDFRDGAMARFTRAQASLQRLGARPASLLSAEQRAALFAADPTLAAARGDALALAAARDDAWLAWRAAADGYANAFLAAHHKEPDKSEAELLAGDAALQAKHADEAATRGARDAAAAALAPRTGLLDEWLAALPEALWRDLDALDEALAELAALQAAAPAALIAGLRSKEEALARNLDAASREARGAAALGNALALREAALAAERELGPRRRLAATRSITTA